MDSFEGKFMCGFRLVATFYDLSEPAWGLSRRQNPRQALAARIPEGAPRILDLCTGTASSAIAMAQTHRQSEIVGVDLSPDMIAVAEEKLRKLGVDNVTIHAMDAALWIIGARPNS
ncbi:MAG: class I SAM-dependent methyltransferase, partial [Anaerolineae bacterium]